MGVRNYRSLLNYDYFDKLLRSEYNAAAHAPVKLQTRESRYMHAEEKCRPRANRLAQRVALSKRRRQQRARASRQISNEFASEITRNREREKQRERERERERERARERERECKRESVKIEHLRRR